MSKQPKKLVPVGTALTPAPGEWTINTGTLFTTLFIYFGVMGIVRTAFPFYYHSLLNTTVVSDFYSTRILGGANLAFIFFFWQYRQVGEAHLVKKFGRTFMIYFTFEVAQAFLSENLTSLGAIVFGISGFFGLALSSLVGLILDF
jgi:hypothetical protein